MKLTWQYASALALNGLVLVACGEPALSSVSTGDGGSKSSDGGASSGCTAGQTQSCTCPSGNGVAGGSGIQHCYEGYWLLCNCNAPPPPTTPVPTGGSCKPGRYEGDFSGVYTSPYTGVGFPIPVVALNPVGPGLAFTLNAEYTAAGEFSELTISDGFVKGAADGVFPFDGVLTGTLDCTTKMFVGKLTGRYCVGPCLGANEGQFDGPIFGSYDGTSFSFTNGTWDLVELEGEKPLFADNYGGNGEWSAHYVGEGTVDLDSGVTSQGGDAGVGP